MQPQTNTAGAPEAGGSGRVPARARRGDFRLYYIVIVIQTIMVLPQKQKYRSLNEDRKSRERPTHLWSVNL